MEPGNLKNILSYILPIHIEDCSSIHNGLLEITLSNGRYVLNSTNANYSFGSLHTIFQRTFSDITIENCNLSNCLLLGLGGGSVVNILQRKYRFSFPITAVEIDPSVIQLANKYFNLSKYQNLSIVNADAFEFVNRSKNHYDIIIVDLYINDIVPGQFHSKEFVSRLRNVAHANTIILFNQIMNKKTNRIAYSELVYQMSQVFGKVSFLTYNINGVENKIICVNTGRVPLSSEKKQKNRHIFTHEVLLNPKLN